jgi:hypothetical protein
MWVAALAMVAVASHGHAATRLELGLGVTGASSDGPQQSGAAASAAMLWEVVPRFEFGPMLFADDLGSNVGRLLDPNNGTDLGAVAEDHRSVYGGAWRGDVQMTRGERWRSAASATWGYYRLRDDQIGVVQSVWSAVGWSIGAAVSRRVRPTVAIGASVRWNQLLEERQDHYVRATVDLMWLRSATADARTPRKATPGNEN